MDKTNEAEVHFIKQEIKKQVVRNNDDYIPMKVKPEIGSYVEMHATKSAIDGFSKIYTKYRFIQTR